MSELPTKYTPDQAAHIAVETLNGTRVEPTPESQGREARCAESSGSAWVRCEDRLPELGEIVWLWEDGRGPWIGSRDDPDSEGWLWGNAYGSIWHNGAKWDAEVEQDDEYKPTHWQPLPLLPNNPDEPRGK